jgi:hypothetical protein
MGVYIELKPFIVNTLHFSPGPTQKTLWHQVQEDLSPHLRNQPDHPREIYKPKDQLQNKVILPSGTILHSHHKKKYIQKAIKQPLQKANKNTCDSRRSERTAIHSWQASEEPPRGQKTRKKYIGCGTSPPQSDFPSSDQACIHPIPRGCHGSNRSS